MNETDKPAAVKIMFKSSSQPKGQDGFELAVSSDATEADVDRTMLLAARAREQAQAVLAGEYTGTGQVEARRCEYCYRDKNMHTEAEWEACQEQNHDRRAEALSDGVS